MKQKSETLAYGAAPWGGNSKDYFSCSLIKNITRFSVSQKVFRIRISAFLHHQNVFSLSFPHKKTFIEDLHN